MGRREGTLENLVKTWHGQRVFLTGHTGFKGSWLALWLNRLGAQVRGYALDPCTEPNMFSLVSGHTDVDDVRGDVRDYARLGLLHKLLHVDDPLHPTAAGLQTIRLDLIDAIQDARRGAPDLSNRLQSDAAKQARKAGIAVRAALEAQWRNA